MTNEKYSVVVDDGLMTVVTPVGEAKALTTMRKGERVETGVMQLGERKAWKVSEMDSAPLCEINGELVRLKEIGPSGIKYWTSEAIEKEEQKAAAKRGRSIVAEARKLDLATLTLFVESKSRIKGLLYGQLAQETAEKVNVIVQEKSGKAATTAGGVKVKALTIAQLMDRILELEASTAATDTEGLEAIKALKTQAFDLRAKQRETVGKMQTARKTKIAKGNAELDEAIEFMENEVAGARERKAANAGKATV